MKNKYSVTYGSSNKLMEDEKTEYFTSFVVAHIVATAKLNDGYSVDLWDIENEKELSEGGNEAQTSPNTEVESKHDALGRYCVADGVYFAENDDGRAYLEADGIKVTFRDTNSNTFKLVSTIVRSYPRGFTKKELYEKATKLTYPPRGKYSRINKTQIYKPLYNFNNEIEGKGITRVYIDRIALKLVVKRLD